MVAILQLKASKLIVYFVSFTVVIFIILKIDRPELKFDRNRNRNRPNLAGTGIWPEPEFDRNFVNRHILLTKMTTRLIILYCTGYISFFKAVNVVTITAAL